MSYTVKKGDTLSQIAKRKGITLRALIAANPKIKNANMIRIGQSINVPEAKKAGDAKVAGQKSSNPYKRMSKTQMSMMDSKNKNKGAQESATRSIRQAVKQGAESRDDDAARKKKDPRGERAAMQKKLEQAKKNAPKAQGYDPANLFSPKGSKPEPYAKRAKAAYERRKKKRKSLLKQKDTYSSPQA